MRRIVPGRFALFCLVVLWSLSSVSIFAASRLSHSPMVTASPSPVSGTLSPPTEAPTPSPTSESRLGTPTGTSTQQETALSTPTLFVSPSPSSVPPPAMPDRRSHHDTSGHQVERPGSRITYHRRDTRALYMMPSPSFIKKRSLGKVE